MPEDKRGGKCPRGSQETPQAALKLDLSKPQVRETCQHVVVKGLNNRRYDFNLAICELLEFVASYAGISRTRHYT